MFGRMSRFFPGVLFVTTGAVVLGASSFASADTIPIFADIDNSTEGIGNFTGSLTYDFIVGDMGVLTVDLTNTSDAGNGGWITGFIFNFGTTDFDAFAQFEKGTHPFEDAQDQNGQPFGNPFMAGAALDGNWFKEVPPEDGIAVGDLGSFSFDVFASDAGSLSASSFLEGSYEFNFIIRFRGFLDESSDKVPATPVPARHRP